MEKKNLWNFEFIKTESFFFVMDLTLMEKLRKGRRCGGGMDIPLDILPFWILEGHDSRNDVLMTSCSSLGRSSWGVGELVRWTETKSFSIRDLRLIQAVDVPFMGKATVSGEMLRSSRKPSLRPISLALICVRSISPLILNWKSSMSPEDSHSRLRFDDAIEPGLCSGLNCVNIEPSLISRFPGCRLDIWN